MLPPRARHEPPAGRGGFAWRYVDVVDANGDGAVLVWGWGLPFLAPDPDAAPADLPSINLAVYRGGRTVFYHLEPLDPADVARVPGGWRFGPHLLQSEDKDGEVRVTARLRLPVAGGAGPALVDVDLRGAAAHGHPREAGPHRWGLLAAGAAASVSVAWPGGRLDLAGRGYHDENVCDRPLGRLGLRTWDWGHVGAGGDTHVHYVCDGVDGGVAHALEVGADGRIRHHPAPRVATDGRVGGTWGLTAPARLDVDGRTVEAGSPVDESSFYLRFPLRSGEARGWGERVRPGAIGSWWMRPLVDLCVTRRPASFLLPWFSGPREDRLRRTLSWWLA